MIPTSDDVLGNYLKAMIKRNKSGERKLRYSSPFININGKTNIVKFKISEVNN